MSERETFVLSPESRAMVIPDVAGQHERVRYACVTAGIPMPPGGVAYVVELLERPGIVNATVVEQGTYASIVGYVDRFSRVFEATEALSMPPAKPESLRLMRFEDAVEDSVAGGSGPDDSDAHDAGSADSDAGATPEVTRGFAELITATGDTLRVARFTVRDGQVVFAAPSGAPSREQAQPQVPQAQAQPQVPQAQAQPQAPLAHAQSDESWEPSLFEGLPFEMFATPEVPGASDEISPTGPEPAIPPVPMPMPVAAAAAYLAFSYLPGLLGFKGRIPSVSEVMRRLKGNLFLSLRSALKLIEKTDEHSRASAPGVLLWLARHLHDLGFPEKTVRDIMPTPGDLTTYDLSWVMADPLSDPLSGMVGFGAAGPTVGSAFEPASELESEPAPEPDDRGPNDVEAGDAEPGETSAPSPAPEPSVFPEPSASPEIPEALEPSDAPESSEAPELAPAPFEPFSLASPLSILGEGIELPEPDIRLVRTVDYADTFYVAFDHSKVSPVGRRWLLEVESVLNRFLLMTEELQHLGALSTATLGECVELDRWLVDRVADQGAQFNQAIVWPESLGDVARPDLDVRVCFARACEELRLPYHLDYRFRFLYDERRLMVDATCPEASVMPRLGWNRESEQLTDLGERDLQGAATRYAFHLAILLVMAGLAAGPAVDEVVVNLWRDHRTNRVPEVAMPPQGLAGVISALLSSGGGLAIIGPGGGLGMGPGMSFGMGAGPIPLLGGSVSPMGPMGSIGPVPAGVSGPMGFAGLMPPAGFASLAQPAGMPASFGPGSAGPFFQVGAASQGGADVSGMPDTNPTDWLAVDGASGDDACILSLRASRQRMCELLGLRSTRPTPAQPSPGQQASAQWMPAQPATGDLATAWELGDVFDIVDRIPHAFTMGRDFELTGAPALASLDAPGMFPESGEVDVEVDMRPLDRVSSIYLHARRICDLGIYEDSPRRGYASEVEASLAIGGASAALAAIREIQDRDGSPLVAQACQRASEAIVSDEVTVESPDALEEIFSDIYGLQARMREASELANEVMRTNSTRPGVVTIVVGSPQAQAMDKATSILESIVDTADLEGWFQDTDEVAYRYFDSYPSRAIYAARCDDDLGGRELRLIPDEYYLAHHRLSMTYASSMEQSEFAIAHARRCVELAPSVAAAHLRLARSYFCCFDYVSEIAELKRAIEVAWNPTDIGLALYWLGYAFWMTGEKRVGAACYQRCVSYDRTLAEASTAELAEFMRKDGQRLSMINEAECDTLIAKAGIDLSVPDENANSLVDVADMVLRAGSLTLARRLVEASAAYLRDDSLVAVLESLGD